MEKFAELQQRLKTAKKQLFDGTNGKYKQYYIFWTVELTVICI